MNARLQAPPVGAITDAFTPVDEAALVTEVQAAGTAWPGRLELLAAAARSAWFVPPRGAGS